MARVVDQKLTLAVGKKSSTTGKCNFQARIFKHWELKRTTPTISLMHFFLKLLFIQILCKLFCHTCTTSSVSVVQAVPLLEASVQWLAFSGHWWPKLWPTTFRRNRPTKPRYFRRRFLFRGLSFRRSKQFLHLVRVLFGPPTIWYLRIGQLDT